LDLGFLTKKMQKIVFVFNSLYFDFIGDALKLKSDFKGTATKETLTNVIDAREKHSSSTTRYISKFTSSLTDVIIDEITKEVVVFYGDSPLASIVIAKKITLGDIISDEESQKQLQGYIYTFALLGYLFKLTSDSTSGSDSDSEESTGVCIEKLVNDTLVQYSRIQKGEALDISPETIYDQKVITLLTKISQVLIVKKDSEDIFGSSASDMLKNSKIGMLAKEISEDIDLSALNIDKPEDFLNPKTFGGENTAALTNIIAQVGSKIQSKLGSGDLNHEDLMSEAMSMLSMLGKDGSAGGAGGGMAAFMNNPMFKDVMKNMGNGGMANMLSMLQNSDSAKSNKVRDRLKSKVAAKKHL
jgi:hypothetical protein